MSKIIKAENLNYISEQNIKNENSKDKKNSDFSKEESEILYNETKKMIEDMIRDAKVESEKIMYEAQVKAEAMLEEKKEELEEVKSEAYKKAYEEGKFQAEEDYREIKIRADEILKAALDEKNTIVENSEKEIIDFIINSIEKIVFSKLKNSGEIAEEISKNLLNYLKDTKETIIIKGNPKDIEFLQVNLKSLKEVLTLGKLELKTDSQINSGHIILISSSGILEVNVEENLNKIKTAIMEVNNYGG